MLTGGVAISYRQVAQAISKPIDEKVENISMTSDEAKQRMQQKGMSPMMINTFLAIAEGQRNGEADVVNTTAEEILGKKPAACSGASQDFLWQQNKKRG